MKEMHDVSTLLLLRLYFYKLMAKIHQQFLAYYWGRSDPTKLSCFVLLHPYLNWEGFLIFRRLVLIIVLTFVYDIQLKRLFVALIVCVMISIVHTFVYPFQRKRDNVLESVSLGAHVVLCGSTLIKTLYFGEEYSFSKSLPLLWWTENVLIIAPLSILIIIVIILFIVARLAFCLKFCTSALIQSVRRLAR